VSERGLQEIEGSDPHSLRLILQEALAERIGVLVETSNVELARRQFYRYKAEDPLLEQLQIRSVFLGGTLFLAICKGKMLVTRPEAEALPPASNTGLFGL